MPKGNPYPDVSEQTELENGPVKVPWRGKARARVRRYLEAAYEDGVDKGIGHAAFVRQKTQVVIKTEEELEAVKNTLSRSVIGRRIARRKAEEIERQVRGESRDDDSDELSGAAKRRKQETDLEVLLNDVVKPHARKRVAEVWPGGTVDVDEIAWFWNPQLSWAAGRAYAGTAVPRRYVDEPKHLAIGLSPEYYYIYGTDELLRTVRHELIHIWQHCHPDSDGIGHGPKFKQWLEDMDTTRHCNPW